MSDMGEHQDLIKKVLKITRRCARDVNQELAKSNPPMDIALTAKQTCISLLVLDLVQDCMRMMPGDFDEVTQVVLNIVGKALKHFKSDPELQDGSYDSNQTTH